LPCKPSLDQHVEDLALGVDGAPQIDHPAIDFQIDFVQMPGRMGFGSAFAQVRCDIGPKWFPRRRTVSQETTIPRSANESSTSRKLSVNRI
jgi:hypothetical protein